MLRKLSRPSLCRNCFIAVSVELRDRSGFHTERASTKGPDSRSPIVPPYHQVSRCAKPSVIGWRSYEFDYGGLANVA
jgi:hypothetical protein